MEVLRGEPDNLSPRLSCIIRSIRLRTVTHRPVEPTGLYIHYASLLVGYSPISSFDGFGSARVFYFWSILYYYYFVYDLIPNLIERLGWTWLSIFSVGGHIWVWSLFHLLYYFILPIYLRSYYVRRAFSFGPWLVQRKSGTLFWPLLGTERPPFIIIFVLSFHG
jgi:hypothetical protein